MKQLTFKKCEEVEDAILFSLLYGIMYVVNSLWLIALLRYSAQFDIPEKLPVWWVRPVPKRPSLYSQLCAVLGAETRAGKDDGVHEFDFDAELATKEATMGSRV